MPGRALDTAMDLAGQIATNAPVAVRASRRVILEDASRRMKLPAGGLSERGHGRSHVERGPARRHRCVRREAATKVWV